MFLCSICEKTIYYGWYCYTCYKKFKLEIESKKPWAKYLQNEEKRRRRRLKKSGVAISDSDFYDLRSIGWGEYGRQKT